MKARLGLLVALALVPVLEGAPAMADDNYPAGLDHWSGFQVQYKLGQSFPSTWAFAVESAAHNWDSVTEFKPGGGEQLAHNDYTDQSTHIIWRGAIPQIWQAQGCVPEIALACTRTVPNGESAPIHILDTDTVFDSGDSMGVGGWSCTFGIDVETVTTHEFGHWVHFRESANTNSVMWPEYSGCVREIDVHDDAAVHLFVATTEQCPFHPCPA